MIALPADLYDMLEASANKYGGIGAGFFSVFTDGHRRPFCVHGHIIYSHGYNDSLATQYDRDRLSAVGLNSLQNDRIVNDAIGYAMTRISWTEYCRVGEIVRKETPSSC